MHFQKWFLFLVCIISSLFVRSQELPSLDSVVSYSSNLGRVYYTPAVLVDNISFSAIKFRNGQPGIWLRLMVEKVVTEKGRRNIDVNPDSISLKLNNEVIAFGKSYRDSIYFSNKGDLLVNTFYLLNPTEIEFLKEKNVTDIIVTVNNKPVVLHISKRSQKMIKEMANNSY
ncbi:hypothetical protein [Pinibacter aurantiacus]|uniref:Uncharacterized protein n=1 Tax=Pinibacter aurantiacus TaxID=2851599 RepID=A0A9E2SB24_9BACT|nr:hypothetical protein [Pinibacter aurantiacus]MBV4359691.1 hypothetical protein [Pinibacter aurantiacus]